MIVLSMFLNRIVERLRIVPAPVWGVYSTLTMVGSLAYCKFTVNAYGHIQQIVDFCMVFSVLAYIYDGSFDAFTNA